MMTRRNVLGAGLAFVAVSSTAALAAQGPAAPMLDEARPADALMVDETIVMPARLAAFVAGRRQILPVVGVRLETSERTRLRQVWDNSRILVGISSGATLFCLERIAWDRGFRLTGRREHCAGQAAETSCQEDLVMFLSGAQPVTPGSPEGTRNYRPSRADGRLHAWVMHKPVSPRHSYSQREA